MGKYLESTLPIPEIQTVFSKCYRLLNSAVRGLPFPELCASLVLVSRKHTFFTSAVALHLQDMPRNPWPTSSLLRPSPSPSSSHVKVSPFTLGHTSCLLQPRLHPFCQLLTYSLVLLTSCCVSDTLTGHVSFLWVAPGLTLLHSPCATHTLAGGWINKGANNWTSQRQCLLLTDWRNTCMTLQREH